MVKMNRYQLVEITVPAAGVSAGARLMIQDQPQLRTQINQMVVIKALVAYDLNTLTVSPGSVPVVDHEAMKNAMLVLNMAGTEKVQYIPMAALKTQRTNATTAGGPFDSWNVDMQELNNIYDIDWTKSYLQFGSAQAGGVSYLLGVYYEYVPATV